MFHLVNLGVKCASDHLGSSIGRGSPEGRDFNAFGKYNRLNVISNFSFISFVLFFSYILL